MVSCRLILRSVCLIDRPNQKLFCSGDEVKIMKMYNLILHWFREHSGFGLYAFSLFVVMSGAYLFFVGWMGFNFDDWEGVFLYRQGFSPEQVWNYFLIDRPFSSLVHLVFHPVLGTSAEAWHIFVLVLHWMAILFIVQGLLILFPSHIMPIGWIGFLLALYPGLTFHFVPRTSAPHYVSMFLFALSFWLMLRAYQQAQGRYWLIALSVVLALAQVLIVEYFAAMELVRFLILLYFFQREFPAHRGRIWVRALMAWLPYLTVFLIFVVFKFQVLPLLAQEEGLQAKHQMVMVQSLLQSPLPTIVEYTNIILRDVIHAVVFAWLLPITPAEVNIASKSFVVSWLLGAFFAALATFVMWGWCQKNKLSAHHLPAAWQVASLSLFVILLGGLPFWLIGREATVGLWSSRFLLAPVLGAVPLVVLVIVGLTGLHRQQVANLALAVLLTGSFSYQFREANRYTLFWEYQRQYYWQLKWRAPGLKPKTFILSPNTPFLRNSSYQIAYAVNLVYAPGNADTDSRYWWFDGPDSLRDFSTQQYKPGIPVFASMRNIRFESDMNAALPVLGRPSRGCLQVLTDTYYQGQPLLSPEEEQLFELAKDGLILQAGPDMPIDVFGPEPEHGWCYYYQKAELARDFDDWQTVRLLWEQIEQKNLRAVYGPNYAPFIESLARNQEWKSAVELTIQAGKTTKEARPFFCNFWQMRLSSLPGFAEWWPEIQREFDCP